MAYFNFSGLIKKYETEFTVIAAGQGGYNDLGEWEVINTEVAKKGAIISISDDQVYNSNGTLTTEDKNLYMSESIGCNYDKAHVIYNGCKYKVERMPNANHEFTGVWAYILKYVSVFGGVHND